METKKAIRKLVFERRAALTKEDAVKNSKIIFDTVMSLPEYKAAKSVYAYMDFKNEVMTVEFIKQAWKDGKRVAAPRVFGKNMTYFWIDSLSQLESGYFGIPEPIPSLCQEADDEDAFLIVPGLAFDRNRRRVGYGQGFYDRYLSVHKRHATCAVAFDFQIVDEVPFDVLDINPQHVITEKEHF